ncbi:hypothetical protein [Parasitella parasitica]|uniref:Reverse transcriptase domain-containing protein n=1 Tax=Parasitella parasitica TaxID=35722 RepID=A0A0B7NAG6_9FUNG|nr:hypothetical protein [Parasitella parasitica]
MKQKTQELAGKIESGKECQDWHSEKDGQNIFVHIMTNNSQDVKDTKQQQMVFAGRINQETGWFLQVFCRLLKPEQGFWQLPLNSEDGSAKNTAFQANGSLYEWVSMPYGCVNGPASFNRLMTIVLLRGLERTIFFCDNVCIFSKNIEQHKEDVVRFFGLLEKYNLRINKKKCKWFSKEVKFLGFLVSGEGIRSNPEKVKAVKEWKAPTNKKDKLRSSFAPNSSIHPNPQLPYDLHCDAFDVGLGAFVVQLGRPIAFASRTLKSAETNYTTTEKECLAIVWALKQFHPYLYGSKFTIFTDHAALKSIMSTKLPRGRLAQWIMALIQDVNAQDFELKDINLSMFQDLQKVDPTVKFILRDGVRKPYVWHNGLVCYSEGNKLLPFVPAGLMSKFCTMCTPRTLQNISVWKRRWPRPRK